MNTGPRPLLKGLRCAGRKGSVAILKVEEAEAAARSGFPARFYVVKADPCWWSRQGASSKEELGPDAKGGVRLAEIDPKSWHAKDMLGNTLVTARPVKPYDQNERWRHA